MAVEELKNQIMEHMRRVQKLQNTRDIAKAIGAKKAEVDRAVADLLKEGQLEYASFGGVSYLKLPDGEAGKA